MCDIYSSMVLTCQTHCHHNRMSSLTFVCCVSFSVDRDVVFGAGYKYISHSWCHSVTTQIIHKGKLGMERHGFSTSVILQMSFVIIYHILSVAYK